MISDYDMRAIALWVHACNMAKEIPVMKTFPPHYLAGLPERDQEVIKQYERLRLETVDEMLALYENDK